MPTPVRPSHPSHPGMDRPSGDSTNKPSSGGFLGADYLYAAPGAVKSGVSSFISHVLNGAALVVKTAFYVIFYPFLNHYEAEITPEMCEDIVKGIKEGTDSNKKFQELEANVRVAVRNRGDTATAKKIIEAFADAEKEVFTKIAQQLIKQSAVDMSQITLTADAYVLSKIQNGSISVTDFYHALNFYRMENVSPEEQLTILEFQVQFAEWYKAEVPHAQKLLVAYAEINPHGFKELALCLEELNPKKIKASDDKSLEEVAKDWIKSHSDFSATQVREALDLKTVKGFIEQIKAEDLFDQPYKLHRFFAEQKGEHKRSNARCDFMAKVFLERLGTAIPKLMQALSRQMIEVDRDNEDKHAGLYAKASEDALWGKSDFDAAHHVQLWVEDKQKFDRNVMINAIQRLEGSVLAQGATDEEQPPSIRLDIFDRALTRLRASQLASFISTFVKAKGNEELGARFIDIFIEFDANKAVRDKVERFIPEQRKEATAEERLDAVVKVAEEVAKKEDTVIQVFRGDLRVAVANKHESQFNADISSEELEFSKKLKIFGLLGKIHSEGKVKEDLVKALVEKLSHVSQASFAELMIHIAEECVETKTHVTVQKLEQQAKAHESHPDVIEQRSQEAYEQRNGLMKMVVAAPQPLTPEERQAAMVRTYSQVFAAHFDSTNASYQTSDLVWLFAGMRSYLNK